MRHLRRALFALALIAAPLTATAAATTDAPCCCDNCDDCGCGCAK
jgi:hypothetical protein